MDKIPYCQMWLIYPKMQQDGKSEKHTFSPNYNKIDFDTLQELNVQTLFCLI